MPLLQVVLEVFTLYRRHITAPEAKCPHNVVAELIALEDQHERHREVTASLKAEPRCPPCQLPSAGLPVYSLRVPCVELSHVGDCHSSLKSSKVFFSSLIGHRCSAASSVASSSDSELGSLFPVTEETYLSWFPNGMLRSLTGPRGRYVLVEASTFALRAVRAIQTLVELHLCGRGAGLFLPGQNQEQTRFAVCMLLEGLKSLLKLCIHWCGPLRICTDEYTLWQLLTEAQQSSSQRATTLEGKLEDRGISAASLSTGSADGHGLGQSYLKGSYCFYVGRRTGKRLFLSRAHQKVMTAFLGTGAVSEDCRLLETAAETAVNPGPQRAATGERSAAERDDSRTSKTGNDEERRSTGRRSIFQRKTTRVREVGVEGGALWMGAEICRENTRVTETSREEESELVEAEAWPSTGIGQGGTSRTRFPILPVFVMLSVRLGSAGVRAGCVHAMEHLGDWRRRLGAKNVKRSRVKNVGTDNEKSSEGPRSETERHGREVRKWLGRDVIPDQRGHRGGAQETAHSNEEGKGERGLQEERTRRRKERHALMQSGRDLIQFIQRHGQ